MPLSNYPPAIAELLAAARPMPLGPGTPVRAAADRLHSLDPSALFAPAPVRDTDAARACLAGLWLRFDFLDESHRISQEIHTPDGNFWHGIMHRREGDFGNAKYWFRRVGNHPVFASLGRETQNPDLFPAGGWDPYQFIDLVEACATRHKGDAEALIQLQEREWEVLFDHCIRKALSD
jgi:hypothetical protein